MSAVAGSASGRRRRSERFGRATLTDAIAADIFVGSRHQILAEPRISTRHVSFRQAVLAADGIGALGSGGGLVERDHAVGALAAKPAIGRNEKILDVDILQGLADLTGDLRRSFGVQRPMRNDPDC